MIFTQSRPKVFFLLEPHFFQMDAENGKQGSTAFSVDMAGNGEIPVCHVYAPQQICTNFHPIWKSPVWGDNFEAREQRGRFRHGHHHLDPIMLDHEDVRLPERGRRASLSPNGVLKWTGPRMRSSSSFSNVRNRSPSAGRQPELRDPFEGPMRIPIDFSNWLKLSVGSPDNAWHVT